MTKKIYMGLPTVKLINVVSWNTSLHTDYSGWDMSSKYTITQNDGYVTIAVNTTASSGAYPCSREFTAIEGSTAETKQIVYWQAKVRGRTTNTSWPSIYYRYYTNGDTDNPGYYFYETAIDGASQGDLNDGNWHILSGRSLTFSDSNSSYFSFDRIAFGIRNCTTVNDTMDACDFLVINLTAAFGSGNEPTKAWCDQNIGFFYGSSGRVLDSYNSSRESVSTRMFRGYIGVNGVARRIIKGYIGVNGVAQKFYGLKEEVGYYDNDLTTSKYRVASAALPNYAVFAGGRYQVGYASAAYDKKVNAIDGRSTGTRKSLADLTTGRIDSAGAAINSYVFFAGGTIYSSSSASTVTSTVEGYDNNLIKISSLSNLGGSRTRMTGASTTSDATSALALFAGGCNNAESTFYSSVYGYNKSLTRSTLTSLEAVKADFASATCADQTYVFAGGKNTNSTPLSSVDAYSYTGSKLTSPTNLAYSRRSLAGAGTNNYILFAGGYLDGGTTPCRITVEAYDSSLTKLDNAANLSTRRKDLAGVSVGEYMFFIGGDTGDYTTPSGKIDIYKGLIKIDFPYELNRARTEISATRAKDLVVIAGGHYEYNEASYKTSTIDILRFE